MQLGIFVGVLGTIHALTVSFLCSGPAFSRGFESLAIARSVVTSGRFANPYMPLATGPTAHLAPLYVLLLASLMQAVGNAPAIAFVVLLNAVLFGALLSLLPHLAALIWGRSSPGLAAALAAIFIPCFVMVPQWEALLFAFGLILFCCLSLSIAPQRRWILGIFAGLITLTNPSGILFFALWGIGLYLFRRWSFLQICAVGVLAFLTCLPWMLRNAEVIGTFAVRDNFGLELYIHNNDLATPSLQTNQKALRTFSPNGNPLEASQVLHLGEKDYNTRKLHAALSWIEGHPVKFLTLSAMRYAMFWIPDRNQLPFSYGVWLMTVLSIPSMISAIRRKRRIESLLIAGMLVFSLPYALVNADLRYRLPVLWITLLFAGESLVQTMAFVRTARLETLGESKRRELAVVAERSCNTTL